MLRQDKVLLQAHPGFLASEEETLAFAQHCHKKGLNLLAASFGFDRFTPDGAVADPASLPQTYDGRNILCHPDYQLIRHTATRMLWQAKQEKPDSLADLCKKGEAWLRQCLAWREEFGVVPAVFDPSFARNEVRQFRDLLGWGFGRKPSKKGYAVLWTRFGYSDFTELAKLPVETCVRGWLRIWEYMGTVHMRHLSLERGKICDRVLLVLDLTNFGMSAVSWLRGFLKNIATQTRYLFPESMAHVLIVNMHWLIRTPTNALSRLFLNPATLYKFRFLSDVSELQEFLDVADIPLYLNGRNADPLLNPCPKTGRLLGGSEREWTERKIVGKKLTVEERKFYLSHRELYDRHGGAEIVSSGVVAAGPDEREKNAVAEKRTSSTSTPSSQTSRNNSGVSGGGRAMSVSAGSSAAVQRQPPPRRQSQSKNTHAPPVPPTPSSNTNVTNEQPPPPEPSSTTNRTETTDAGSSVEPAPPPPLPTAAALQAPPNLAPTLMKPAEMNGGEDIRIRDGQPQFSGSSTASASSSAGSLSRPSSSDSADNHSGTSVAPAPAPPVEAAPAAASASATKPSKENKIRAPSPAANGGKAILAAVLSGGGPASSSSTPPSPSTTEAARPQRLSSKVRRDSSASSASDRSCTFVSVRENLSEQELLDEQQSSLPAAVENPTLIGDPPDHGVATSPPDSTKTSAVNLTITGTGDDAQPHPQIPAESQAQVQQDSRPAPEPQAPVRVVTVTRAAAQPSSSTTGRGPTAKIRASTGDHAGSKDSTLTSPTEDVGYEGPRQQTMRRTGSGHARAGTSRGPVFNEVNTGPQLPAPARQSRASTGAAATSSASSDSPSVPAAAAAPSSTSSAGMSSRQKLKSAEPVSSGGKGNASAARTSSDGGAATANSKNFNSGSSSTSTSSPVAPQGRRFGGQTPSPSPSDFSSAGGGPGCTTSLQRGGSSFLSHLADRFSAVRKCGLGPASSPASSPDSGPGGGGHGTPHARQEAVEAAYNTTTGAQVEVIPAQGPLRSSDRRRHAGASHSCAHASCATRFLTEIEW
eukprot:CAMPEP_0178992196 /NCGR_PEP_ID=MMETSP0795-20121207/5969_1 /TAXON_ID=88552 /ORGANISM="Amoebophrya sp., Strain Ameob2" /LENGTH=1038 /DNA_ID=CAMNT_0020684029 /DNA_START=538 /DNA_END=3652 /DNA_ORIENTATION=+